MENVYKTQYRFEAFCSSRFTKFHTSIVIVCDDLYHVDISCSRWTRYSCYARKSAPALWSRLEARKPVSPSGYTSFKVVSNTRINCYHTSWKYWSVSLMLSLKNLCIGLRIMIVSILFVNSITRFWLFNINP